MRRLPGQQPRGFDPRRHVRQLDLDRLVLGNRLAESLARLGIGQGLFKARPRDTDPARRDIDAAKIRVELPGEEPTDYMRAVPCEAPREKQCLT